MAEKGKEPEYETVEVTDECGEYGVVIVKNGKDNAGKDPNNNNIYTLGAPVRNIHASLRRQGR